MAAATYKMTETTNEDGRVYGAVVKATHGSGGPLTEALAQLAGLVAWANRHGRAVARVQNPYGALVALEVAAQ